MPARTTQTVEVESLTDFDRLVAHGATRMHGWRVQGVDLRSRTSDLRRLDPAGAILLGVAVDDETEKHLRSGGALVFPRIPALPFDPYRGELYSPAELYAGIETSYEQTPDAQIYAWSRGSGHDLANHLARALHDHAIDDALAEHVADRATVGVMGGHAWARDDPRYADAAQLGQRAARAGLTVATGGGPGAMEAANLGAYLADAGHGALDDALETLRGAVSFSSSIAAWARSAMDVRRRWPHGRDSIGIPTWHYGHEPPNAFASSVAKYFQNSLREDTLLRFCQAGIVFLPGAAGTVQEVFQDACENYYAAVEAVAPMVLVGETYWTETVPAWPLLERLAQHRPMADAIHLVDSVDEALGLLEVSIRR